jgi:hypothetical protein
MGAKLTIASILTATREPVMILMSQKVWSLRDLYHDIVRRKSLSVLELSGSVAAIGHARVSPQKR